jgi:pimeloyl-ACP methyl ester carboxylesterase
MASFRRFREYSTFGGSFGGQLAQSFATRSPTKLRKLILASTTAKVEIDGILDAFEDPPEGF